MEDPSLPAGGDGGGGPGTHSEGNFVLTNFTIDAVEGVPLPDLDGDYNDNDVVDAADYVQWRKSLTTQDPLANDPLGLPIDQDQYDQWRENFGNMSGSGAASLDRLRFPNPPHGYSPRLRQFGGLSQNACAKATTYTGVHFFCIECKK